MAVRHKTLGVLYLDEDNVVQFGFNSLPPTKKVGIELLLQNIIIRLFTDQGSNGFEDSLGGGLLNLIGGGYEPGQEDVLRSNFSFAFLATEQQIKDEQASQDLPPSETLRSITLKSVEYNTNTYTWEIVIKVLTEAGLSSTFTIIE